MTSELAKANSTVIVLLKRKSGPRAFRNLKRVQNLGGRDDHAEEVKSLREGVVLSSIEEIRAEMPQGSVLGTAVQKKNREVRFQPGSLDQ